MEASSSELLLEVWAVLSANTPFRWALALCAAVVAFALGFGARRIVRRRYALAAATEHVEWLEVPLEVASKTSSLVLVLGALYAGFSLLTLPAALRSGAGAVMTAVLFWQLGVWGSASVVAWLAARRKLADERDRAALGSFGIIGFVLRLLVWVLIALLALDNFGVDITALVAGLGVGGIAVALAVQNVLGDLFASLSITLDRPFVLGDFIIVDDFMGSVEQIGVKSTRLRSLGGEQIILANADLLGSRVRNYGRMVERRVVFAVGIVYDTPAELVEQVPGMIRAAVEAVPTLRFDRSHFSGFGDSSLNFETVYYVLSPDYTVYMDAQQAVYLAILKEFAARGVAFAYPTRRLILDPLQIDERAAAHRELAPPSRS